MKILIIGKVWPEPNSSAAGRRMKQLIQLLQKRGEIHFACANAFTGNEIDLKELNVHIKHIELNNDSVNDYFRELNPEIVVFDRFLTEEQYGWRVIEHCPDAIRILNTEDLHFLRKTRQQYVKKTGGFTANTTILDFQNDETMRELASIYRCDSTLMISTKEIELLQDEMGVSSELLEYLPIFTEQKPITSSFEKRTDFLFIGNVLHEPNADAIRILTEHIWPIIHKQLPQAQLLIAGAYPTQAVLQLDSQSKGIKVVGHVKDLEQLYATVRVSLMPLRFGAGIKGKIIESMEYGILFVSTSIGTEGLFVDDGWENCIADNWEDFAKKSISQYCDVTQWNDHRNRGFEHLKNHFEKADYEAKFLNFIDDLIENIKAKRKKRYFSQLVQHHTLMSTRYLSKWIMEKNKG